MYAILRSWHRVQIYRYVKYTYRYCDLNVVAYFKFLMLLTTLAYTGDIIIMAVELRNGRGKR